ncbi:MAG: sugar ABC transporter permease [Bosea sp.]|nr:sugar ABC transporter permease [Bosea sp. (in: a-proteobacteria)]
MSRSRSASAWLYVLPALILFTLLVIVPIIWSLSFSVFKWNGIGAKVFIGIGNYVRMWNDGLFRRAFVNNLIFAGLGTVVQVVLGMGMAILLMSITRFRDFVKVAYFIPCVISSVAICQIFAKLFALNPEGVFNALLGAAGLAAWKGAPLSDPHLALVIVTLVDAYKFCAIYMVIYFSAFMGIDAQLLEAAELDGANWWQRYVHVRFPMIRTVFLISLVVLISGTLKGFDVSYILTGGGPGASSELVSTYMYKTIFNSLNFGYGSAIAVFLAVECLLAVAIMQRLFRSSGQERM